VAYSPCGSQHKDAVQITLEQIDLIKRLMVDYGKHLQLVTTANGESTLMKRPEFTENFQTW
jgi:membrane dipeptidase